MPDPQQVHTHPVDPVKVDRARQRLPSTEHATRLAGLLGLLADPNRARVLSALDLVEELCVGDLALALGVTEDAAGYAVRVLRTAGLVTRRKQGRVVYYRLTEGFPPALRQSLRRLVEVCELPPVDEE